MSKFVVFVVAVAALWYGYRWLERQGYVGNLKRKPVASNRRDVMVAEETVKCPACGVYLTRADAQDCGQAGCPFPKA
jgi:uncharacterized protein